MRIRHLLLMVAMVAISATASAQTTGEKIKAFADEHLNLSGYLQGGFEWNEASDPTTSFYLKRARLSLTGDFLKEKFDYRLQVDMAGSPKICDLYIRYKPLNELNVQLGQFKLPFALENELCGPTTFEFIEYSYITTYFSRNNGKYDGINGATGRDIGAQLYGGFIEHDGYNIINYNVGVYNGAGINTKDNNSSKDFVGRLTVKPIKELSVSASYMYSEVEYTIKSDKQHELDKDGNLVHPENRVIEYMKAPRWSVGVWYSSRHWVARSEFAQANFGGNLTNGFYILGGYHFEQPWSFVARYEFIDDKFNMLDEQRVTLGGAYKPFKFLRLQLNASYVFNDVNNRNTPGINLMATAMF